MCRQNLREFVASRGVKRHQERSEGRWDVHLRGGLGPTESKVTRLVKSCAAFLLSLFLFFLFYSLPAFLLSYFFFSNKILVLSRSSFKAARSAVTRFKHISYLLVGPKNPFNLTLDIILTSWVIWDPSLQQMKGSFQRGNERLLGKAIALAIMKCDSHSPGWEDIDRKTMKETLE